jgi:hypothetical protein
MEQKEVIMPKNLVAGTVAVVTIVCAAWLGMNWHVLACAGVLALGLMMAWALKED